MSLFSFFVEEVSYIHYAHKNSDLSDIFIFNLKIKNVGRNIQKYTNVSSKESLQVKL